MFNYKYNYNIGYLIIIDLPSPRNYNININLKIISENFFFFFFKYILNFPISGDLSILVKTVSLGNPNYPLHVIVTAKPSVGHQYNSELHSFVSWTQKKWQKILFSII